MRLGIDFGSSNTDVVVQILGEKPLFTTLPVMPLPDETSIRIVLEHCGIPAENLTHIAISGGNRSKIPKRIGPIPVFQTGEIQAIALGARALAEIPPGTATVVVSAGSGTAVVKLQGTTIEHLTGTGIGGGTLIGLSRLLLNTHHPDEIDRLALAGKSHAVNLTIGDVIGGSFGRLPEDATAVNFGRIARNGMEARPEDIAAALVELVAQVIAVVGINAARSEQVENIVITGHLCDMESIRAVFERISGFSGIHYTIPVHPGYAVALGALCYHDNPNIPRS